MYDGIYDDISVEFMRKNKLTPHIRLLQQQVKISLQLKSRGLFRFSDLLRSIGDVDISFQK